jgi:hypothetical protein
MFSFTQLIHKTIISNKGQNGWLASFGQTTPEKQELLQYTKELCGL